MLHPFFLKIFSSFLLLISCSIGFEGGLKAQHSSSNSLKTGKQQWEKGAFEEAYASFRLAQQEAISSGNARNWADATLQIGTYFSRQMQVEAAALTLDSVIQQDSTRLLKSFIFRARKERAYLDLMQNQIPEAVTKYEAIIADAGEAGIWGDTIRGQALEGLGQAHFYMGNFEGGLAKSKEALKVYQALYEKDDIQIGICSNTLGIMYMYLDEFKEAIHFYTQAEQIFAASYAPDHSNLLQLKTNLGVLYGELGLFWKALAYHRDVYQHLDKLEPSAHLNALLNLGTTLMTVGDYQSAEDYLKQAEIYAENFPELKEKNGAYIAQQRSSFFQQVGKNEQALFQIEKSIAKNDKLLGENHPEQIVPYLQKGSLLMSLKEYEKAYDAFQKMLKLVQSHIGPLSLQGGHAYREIGNVIFQQGNPHHALIPYQKAAENYNHIENHFALADIYVKMAKTWRAMGELDSCLALHQKAWESLFPTRPFKLSPTADARAYWAVHPMEEMMFEQGNSLKEMFRVMNSASYLKSALASYEMALAVVDSQRHYYESAISRQIRLEEQLPVYEAAIAACYELYEHTSEKTFLEKAFFLAEKSKANALRDHLRGVEALRFSSLPDSILELERYYRQRLAAVNQEQLQTQLDSLAVSKLEKEAFDLQHDYHLFIKNLEQNHVAYYQLKYGDSSPEASLIYAKLKTGELMYSYFWGKEILYIFKLSQGEIEAFQVVYPEVLPKLNHWITHISHPPQASQEDIVALADQAFQLSQMLLPGLSSECQKLTILPDGQLGYLSFESLLAAETKEADYRQWPFIGKTFSLTYASAAELWFKQARKPSFGSKYVGFAPIFEEGEQKGNRAGLSALRYNREEIAAVAEILKGSALLGKEAEEAYLKNLDESSYILHFATHALADESQLMYSRLFLEGNQETSEDGILYAYEIYNLQLNSPLCVLSACQTAQGPLQNGEGIMSLARAFQYSGCKQVMSTLWQTDDKAAAEMSSHFFAALAAGESSEKALQKARNAWLKGSDSYHAHPYFWAHFVLIGEGGKIQVGNANRKIWFWGIGGLLVFLIGTWVQKRKS